MMCSKLGGPSVYAVQAGSGDRPETLGMPKQPAVPTFFALACMYVFIFLRQILTFFEHFQHLHLI